MVHYNSIVNLQSHVVSANYSQLLADNICGTISRGETNSYKKYTLQEVEIMVRIALERWDSWDMAGRVDDLQAKCLL